MKFEIEEGSQSRHQKESKRKEIQHIQENMWGVCLKKLRWSIEK